MRVAELIEALQAEDPHAEVVIGGARLVGRLDGTPSTVDLCPDADLSGGWVCTCGALAAAEGACDCG